MQVFLTASKFVIQNVTNWGCWYEFILWNYSNQDDYTADCWINPPFDSVINFVSKTNYWANVDYDWWSFVSSHVQHTTSSQIPYDFKHLYCKILYTLWFDLGDQYWVLLRGLLPPSGSRSTSALMLMIYALLYRVYGNVMSVLKIVFYFTFYSASYYTGTIYLFDWINN